MEKKKEKNENDFDHDKLNVIEKQRMKKQINQEIRNKDLK